jgi:hypothetical protein
LIGGPRQISEQRHHLIRIVAQSLLDCRFVELADLGRHMFETLVATKLAT